jgi:hypothetical protein
MQDISELQDRDAGERDVIATEAKFVNFPMARDSLVKQWFTCTRCAAREGGRDNLTWLTCKNRGSSL